MNNSSRFRKASLFLSSIGFATSLFFCAYALGMFQVVSERLSKMPKDGPKFSGGNVSYDSLYEAFLRFGLIAILFVVSALITRFTNNVFLKLLNILLLAVICFQGYIALREPIDALYYLYEDDSSLLIRIIALFICFAGLIILPAVILIILQFFSFRNSITGKNSDSLN